MFYNVNIKFNKGKHMSESKSLVLFFRATPKLKKKLEDFSTEKDWTMSKTIEKIISEYFNVTK